MIKKSEKFIILHFIIFSTLKMFIILHFIIFSTNLEIFIIFILSYFKYDNILLALDFRQKQFSLIFGRCNFLSNIFGQSQRAMLWMFCSCRMLSLAKLKYKFKDRIQKCSHYCTGYETSYEPSQEKLMFKLHEVQNQYSAVISRPS